MRINKKRQVKKLTDKGKEKEVFSAKLVHFMK